MPVDQSQELWSAWGRQLQAEFVDICYQYSIKLIPPVIEIIDATRAYGSWQADTRTLGISCHLIGKYDWDITLNVLKHEMAHQICSEIFRHAGHPHDKEFLRAAELLGLPQEYCRATIDFAKIFRESSAGLQPKDRKLILMARIKKLLAMTASSNEHEALSALQMAGRIMEKYSLEGPAELEQADVTYRIIKTGKKRIEGYQRHIASILSRFFRVKLIYSRLYDPSSDAVYKTFEIFGRCENVEIAEHCFYFLENRLASLWQKNQKVFAAAGRGARKSYYLGILHGFREKLQAKDEREGRRMYTEHSSAIPARSMAQLSVDHDEMVQRCVQRRYPQLRLMKQSRQLVSPSIYNEGKAAGKELVLSKALRQREDQGKTRLLT